MGVIHDPPYRPTKGKFCIIAESPVNIGVRMLQKSAAKMEGKRAAAANNSRKRWRLAKRLQPTPLQALRDFYDARSGPTEPFYFYDPYETNPKFSWDPTGVATTGRYTVRFDGEWSQTVGPGRSDLSIELIELA